MPPIVWRKLRFVRRCCGAGFMEPLKKVLFPVVLVPAERLWIVGALAGGVAPARHSAGLWSAFPRGAGVQVPRRGLPARSAMRRAGQLAPVPSVAASSARRCSSGAFPSALSAHERIFSERERASPGGPPEGGRPGIGPQGPMGREGALMGRQGPPTLSGDWHRGRCARCLPSSPPSAKHLVELLGALRPVQAAGLRCRRLASPGVRQVVC